MVNMMKITVKDPSNTRLASEMVPAGNELVNAFTKENVCILGIKFGINHKTSNTTVVRISAIIWFSVKLEANIPKAI